jgi:hypothetical protein
LYDSRPWVRFADVLAPGVEARYTCRDDTLYAILLTPAPSGSLAFSGLALPPGGRVSIAENGQILDWSVRDGSLQVSLPSPLEAFSLLAIGPVNP